MHRFKKRLDALEHAKRRRPRVPAMAAALLRCYGTDEERAAWEAAGRPEVDRATWAQVLDAVYGE